MRRAKEDNPLFEEAKSMEVARKGLLEFAGDEDSAQQMEEAMAHNAIMELEKLRRENHVPAEPTPVEPDLTGVTSPLKIRARQQEAARRNAEAREQYERDKATAEARLAEAERKAKFWAEIAGVEMKSEETREAADGNARMSIESSGTGVFGKIYNQFVGKVKDAVEFLLKNRSGDLTGVFHRNGFGSIDLVWGDNNGGFEHIIKKHVGEGKSFATPEEAGRVIDDIIKTGEIEFENGDKIVFIKDGRKVTVRKNYRKGGKKIADKNWVLTAYDENSADNGSSAITNVNQAKAAPGTESSERKGNTLQSDKQEGAAKSSMSEDNTEQSAPPFGMTEVERPEMDKATARVVAAAERAGLKVRFFEGPRGQQGVYYDGTIWVNRNATKDSKAFIAGHELNHAIFEMLGGDAKAKEAYVKAAMDVMRGVWGEDFDVKYAQMRDMYIEHESTSRGISLEEAAKMVDDAYMAEELAGDGIGHMLDNPQAADRFFRGITDRSTLRRVYDAIRNWIQNAMTYFKNDGAKLRQMYELADEFAKAYKKADAEVKRNEEAKYNLRQYEESGRNTLTNKLKDLVTKGKLDQKTADEISSATEYAYEVCKAMQGEFESFDNWSVQEVRTEMSYYNADGKTKRKKPVTQAVFSVIKKNGDYTMNMDFSLLCKKRETSDFLTASSFDNMRINFSDVLKFYNMKKGTGGPKASSHNQPYHNEILSTRWTPERAYKVGGVRLQSFSDFQGRMVFDYIQLIADLAAKKLPVHAYTKEVLFAKLFGLTGMKINLSLIPSAVVDGVAPGLDAKGDYVWADGQSFPFEEAVKLMGMEGYRDNCGTIAIGVSRPQILKMLADPLIRMIIPYHSSGIPADVARMHGIYKFEDYTKVQNTRQANGNALTDEQKKKDFNYNAALRKYGDARVAANKYLEWCEKNNYIPKFDEFADHPNYYKLLEDFTTMVPDGKGGEYNAEMHEVRPIFPGAEHNKADKGFGDLATLIRETLEFDNNDVNQRKEYLSGIVEQTKEELFTPERLSAGDYDLQVEEELGVAPQTAEKKGPKMSLAMEEESDSMRYRDVSEEMQREMDAIPEEELEHVYRNVMILPDGSLASPMAVYDAKTGAIRTLKQGWWNGPEEHEVVLTDEQLALYDALQRNGYVIINGEKVTEFNIADDLKFVATGKGPVLKYNLQRSTNDEMWVDYNPYDHAIKVALNDQFSAAWKRPNLVVVEAVVPKSEIDEKYKAPYANLTTGEHTWSNGRKLILSRYSKILRIVPNAEVAKMIDEYWKANPEKYGGKRSTDIGNFTPQVRAELEKLGYEFNDRAAGKGKPLIGKMTQEELEKEYKTEKSFYVTDADIEAMNANFEHKWQEMPQVKSDRELNRFDANPESLRRKVEGITERLGVKVRIVSDIAELDDATARQRAAKGWFDTKTGEVVIVAPNHLNVRDVENTVLHEVVGHKGLRKLVGEEKFADFLDNVYMRATDAIREQIDALIPEDKKDSISARRTAMEEYLSDLAGRIGERGFEKMSAEEKTVWSKICDMVQKLIDKTLQGLGIPKSIKLSERQMSYIVYKSWANLKSGVLAEAQDAAMRYNTRYELQGEILYRGKRNKYKKTGRAEASTGSTIGDIQPGLNPSTSLKPNHATKLIQNIGIVKKRLGELAEFYQETSNPEGFLTNLKIALGLEDQSFSEYLKEKREPSFYRTLELPNGKSVDIRVSNHNANAENANESIPMISIVIKGKSSKNTFRADENKIVNEYVYFGQSLRNASVGTMSKIANSIAEAFNTGIYIDKTGLAVENHSPKQNDSKLYGGNIFDEAKRIASEYNRERGIETEEGPEDDRPDGGTPGGGGGSRRGPRMSLSSGDNYSGRVSAAGGYNKRVTKSGWQAREAFQDSMLGLKTLMEEIEKATRGKKAARRIQDIDGFENAYLKENAMSSANHAQQKQYQRNLVMPTREF